MLDCWLEDVFDKLDELFKVVGVIVVIKSSASRFWPRPEYVFEWVLKFEFLFSKLDSEKDGWRVINWDPKFWLLWFIMLVVELREVWLV